LNHHSDVQKDIGRADELRGTQRLKAAKKDCRWPTGEMIGWARQNGIDPAEVTDIILADYGEPGSDPEIREQFTRAWYAAANGVAEGYEVCLENYIQDEEAVA
jgi:hypothetical protein